MMYDHKKDPEENINVANDSSYQEEINSMETSLEEDDKLEF